MFFFNLTENGFRARIIAKVSEKAAEKRKLMAIQFERKKQEDPDYYRKIWFSDESWFYLEEDMVILIFKNFKFIFEKVRTNWHVV